MNNRGSVLIFLLLITGVISFFLMQTLYYAKLNQELCYNYNKNFLLKQEFQKITMLFSELIRNKNLYNEYFDDSIFKYFATEQDLTIDKRKFKIALKRESELVDINIKNAAQIKSVVEKIFQDDYDEVKISEIVDSIFDWIDPDDLKRINGAEKEEYKKFGYEPPNGNLKDIFELKKIKGIDEDTFFKISINDDENTEYKGLFPYLTIYKNGFSRYDILSKKNLVYKNILRLYVRPDNSKKLYVLFIGEKGNIFYLLKWKRLI